jgi:methionyl-tRNA synthetase
MREVPFGNDGDFSHDAVVGRMNSDLANDLGNLAQRVLSMINKNCDAKVPDPGQVGPDSGLAVYAPLLGAQALRDKLRDHMDRQGFNDALEEIWRIVRDSNRCVDEDAPWALRKTDPVKMASVLYVMAETIRHLAIVLQPFMPDSCARMLDQLSVAEEARSFDDLGTALVPGTALPKPEGVFPRMVDETAS